MSYPNLLKRKDILDTINLLLSQDKFKNLIFTIAESDLLHPESIKVSQIYLLFMEAIFPGSSLRIGQMPFVTIVDFPVLYDDATSRVQFILLVEKLFTDLSIDFDISDLFEPTHKRLMRNLSSIINYLRCVYFTSGLVGYEQCTYGQEEAAEQSEQLSLENSEIKHRIEQLEHIRKQEEDEVTKLVESQQAVETAMEELQAQEVLARDDLERLGTRQEELVHETSKRESQLKGYHDGLEKLERKVVRCSPSKLRKEVAEVQRMAQESIRQNEAIGFSTDSYLKLSSSVQKLTPQLGAVVDTHDAVVKKESQLQQRQSDLNAFRDTLVKGQRRSQELKQEIKAIDGRTKSFDQRLHQLTLKNHKLGGSVGGKAYQREKDILELEMAQLEKVKLQVSEEAEELQMKMAEMVSEFQERTQVLESKREEISRTCMDAHQAATKVGP